MAEINKVEVLVQPQVPKVIDNQQIMVYVPTATNDSMGLIRPNKDEFYVENGQLNIKWAVDDNGNPYYDNIHDVLEDVAKIDGLERDFNTLKDVTLPTDYVKDSFLKANYYTSSEVNNLINTIGKYRSESVDVLPPVEEALDGVIYLVPHEDDEYENNSKDEYIILRDGVTGERKWELIGNTNVKLTYINSNPTENTVGGIAAGSTYFSTKKDLIDVVDRMFYFKQPTAKFYLTVRGETDLGEEDVVLDTYESIRADSLRLRLYGTLEEIKHIKVIIEDEITGLRELYDSELSIKPPYGEYESVPIQFENTVTINSNSRITVTCYLNENGVGRTFSVTQKYYFVRPMYYGTTSLGYDGTELTIDDMLLDQTHTESGIIFDGYSTQYPAKYHKNVLRPSEPVTVPRTIEFVLQNGLINSKIFIVSPYEIERIKWNGEEYIDAFESKYDSANKYYGYLLANYTTYERKIEFDVTYLAKGDNR